MLTLQRVENLAKVYLIDSVIIKNVEYGMANLSDGTQISLMCGQEYSEILYCPLPKRNTKKKCLILALRKYLQEHHCHKKRVMFKKNIT